MSVCVCECVSFGPGHPFKDFSVLKLSIGNGCKWIAKLPDPGTGGGGLLFRMHFLREFPFLVRINSRIAICFNC